MKIFILLSLVLAAGSLRGQNVNPMTDTVEWTYNQMVNLSNSETLPWQGRLVSHGTGDLEWIQNGGIVYILDTQSTNGTWTELSANGQITYQVTCSGVSGTVNLSRGEGGLQAEIDLSGENPLSPHVSLNVVSATKP